MMPVAMVLLGACKTYHSVKLYLTHDEIDVKLAEAAAYIYILSATYHGN